jgi:hypothetical protein
MERAADNLDKLELKVQKSLTKEKKVRERKKGWEDVNEEKKEKKQKNAFEALEDQDDDREWVSDEEMPEVELGAEDVAGAVKAVPVADSVPLAVANVEEDEML